MTHTGCTLRTAGREARTALTAGVVLLLLAGLAACGEGPRASRTDLHGDPLPPGALVRLGSSRLRQAYADDLKFSPDGKRLISCSSRMGTVSTWDAASGKLLQRRRLTREPAWEDT